VVGPTNTICPLAYAADHLRDNCADRRRATKWDAS
jgi:hypothetical protein